VRDLHPLCLVGTSKGTVFALPLKKELTPLMIYQDAKRGVVLDMVPTTTVLSLDSGKSNVNLVAIAMGVGDVLIMSIKRSSEESKDPYECEIKEVSRFFVSEMKIVNMFIFKE
jgi:hypothetical protein